MLAAAWPMAIVAPSSREPARHRAFGEIGTRHRIALRDQHLGDAAHPGAADADEVDALDLVLHRGVPSATQTSATRCGGVALAVRVRGARHRQRARAIDASQEIGKALRRQSRLRLLQCGARVDQELRVGALLVGDGARQRHHDRAQADGRELGNRQRAAAADHEVRPRIARRHVVDEGDAFGGNAMPRVCCAQARDVPLARLMHDRRPLARHRARNRRGHELVQRLRAETAADDQQPQRPVACRRSAARAAAARRSRRAADCRPIRQLCMAAAQRVREAQQDPVGAVGQHARRESGDGVGVVQHQRLARRRAHQPAGKRCEAAEAQHDVGHPPPDDRRAPRGTRPAARKDPAAACAIPCRECRGTTGSRTRRHAAAPVSPRCLRACPARTR